jgi:hypothetical protein
MATNIENLTRAGEYVIDNAEILSYRIAGGAPGSQEPFRMNITGIIGKLEFDQNLFQHSMYGKIQVLDANDIRTILPITGLDKLNLSFHTPGLEGPRGVAGNDDGHPFHITRIENVAPDIKAGKNLQAYDIYFCSREIMFNQIHKVSKAYDGPVELAVEDIFTNKKYLNSRKQLYIEPTHLPTKIVIPNTSPFRAINMLQQRAISKRYQNAGYLFYENNDGYHFRSIESLLAMAGAGRRPARWNYRMQVAPIRGHHGGRDVESDLEGVSSWSITKPIDMVDSISQGAYASKLIEHDMFYKKVTTSNYDYDKDWENHFHMEIKGDNKNTPLPYANFEDTFKKLSEEYDSKVMLKSHTSNIHNDKFNASSKLTYQKAISQRRLLFNGTLQFVAKGLSHLQIGDTINFDVPLITSKGHNKKQELSPYWSGRYLIYEIKHVLNKSPEDYTIHVKAFKDNPAEAYPEEYNSWTHLAQGKTHNVYDLDDKVIGDAGISSKFGL